MSKSLFSIIRIIKFIRDKEVGLSKKLLFLVPVIYLLFPFDLIGDFFPIAGQLDDVAVFVLMWPILKSLLSKYSSGTGPKNNRNNKNNKKDKDAIDIDKDDYDVK